MLWLKRLAGVAALTVALSPVASAATPIPRTISLRLARVNVVDSTHVVLSMEGTGDIRGLLTLTADRAADGTITGGTWVFVARYVEYLTETGVPVHDDDPPPPSGEEVGPNLRFINLGSLSGAIDGGFFTVGDDGVPTGLGSVQLTVASGNLTFEGASGTGSGAASAINDQQASSGSLTLTF